MNARLHLSSPQEVSSEFLRNAPQDLGLSVAPDGVPMAEDFPATIEG